MTNLKQLFISVKKVRQSELIDVYCTYVLGLGQGAQYQ